MSATRLLDQFDAPLAPHLARRVQFLTRCVAQDARLASRIDDVASVTTAVQLIKRHRPLVVDIVESSNLDGSDLRRYTVECEDGTYVALLEPRTLCADHDQAEDWPCRQISDYAHLHAEHPEFRFEDWRRRS